MVTVPEQPLIGNINGTVRFEHAPLPFLDSEDLRAMLTGSYDIILCDFLKGNLAPADIVLDVGANVGYISAVAASCVGKSGEVHGFEPLPECFNRLERLRELNPEFPFFFNNVALGKEEGVLPISYNPDGDSRNATLVPGKQSPATKQVPVRRLDEYAATQISSPERIRLIKIDVEGFEFPVLQGFEGFLKSHQPQIVCEIKPWELKKLGATIGEFDRFMKSFGYRSYVITQMDTPIDLAKLDDMEVVVFRK
ncbi:MAG: FkbM family methyltransferase [Acidobacteriota bacterium]|nr:FkbM family methyltransferase [Acidobacteriota bacterium]